MAFRDITDILGPIRLPVRGKDYTLPTLTLAQGLELRDVLDPADPKTLDDEAFYEFLLGDALTEMRHDGVGADVIARAAFVALADFQSGRPAAEALWETGLDPKVLTNYVESVKNATPPSTGGAAKTPSRASTSGTKPRKK